MADPDLLAQLEHDHGPLTESVDTLRAMIQRVPSSDADAQLEAAQELHAAFAEAVSEFRDDLLEHFGREEECMFPFLVETLPELRESIEALESGHDQICGALVRLGYLAEREPLFEQWAQIVNTWGRFEASYLAHAATERDLLRHAIASLDADQRAALRRAEQGLL